MKVALISSALLISGSAIAATPLDGWYSGVFGGAAYIPNNIDNTSYFIFKRDGVKYNDAYNAGARLGLQGYPLRYEAEFTYLRGNVDRFFLNNIPQYNVGSYTEGYFGMANVYYDFPDIIPTIQPFLGLGIGYGWVQTKLTSNNIHAYFKESDSVFAYQGIAGLTYNFSENYAINLAYRYIATEIPDHFGKIYQAHLGIIGVTYRFNEISYQ